MQDMIEQEEMVAWNKKNYSDIFIDDQFIGETLGRLYYEYNYLSSTQLNIIKGQFEKPSYDYKVHPRSLWAFYQHVTYALTFETAGDYLETRRGIQEYFANYVYRLSQYAILNEESPS